MTCGRAPIALEEDLLFIDSSDNELSWVPSTIIAQSQPRHDDGSPGSSPVLTGNGTTNQHDAVADVGEEVPMLGCIPGANDTIVDQGHRGNMDEKQRDVDGRQVGDNPPSSTGKSIEERVVASKDNDEFEWLSSSDLQETLVDDPEPDGACAVVRGPDRADDCLGAEDVLPPRKNSALSSSRENIEDNDSKEYLSSPARHAVSSAHRKEYLLGIFLKYSIFIFNFLFWVASVCAFAFGYWLFTSKGHLFRGGVYVMMDPAVLLCIVGCTIFVVAFFGFLGALRENLLLLMIFRVSLLAVLLVQIGVGLMMFVFYTMPEARKSILSGPEGVLKDAIKHYHDDVEMRKWIDLIQKEFECCGISHSNEGFRDWQINMYFNCSLLNPSIERCAVPVSCCILEPGDYVNVMCGFDTTNEDREDVLNRIYTKGCMQGLADWMRSNESFIGAFLLVFITPQVLGVVFSTLYIKHIRKNLARWTRLKGI